MKSAKNKTKIDVGTNINPPKENKKRENPNKHSYRVGNSMSVFTFDIVETKEMKAEHKKISLSFSLIEGSDIQNQIVRDNISVRGYVIIHHDFKIVTNEQNVLCKPRNFSDHYIEQYKIDLQPETSGKCKFVLDLPLRNPELNAELVEYCSRNTTGTRKVIDYFYITMKIVEPISEFEKQYVMVHASLE